MTIDRQSGRRTPAEFADTIDIVEKILGPAPTLGLAPFKPAMLHPLRDVEHPRRLVPGQMLVALAVGVDGQQLPGGREVDVVRIAKAVGDHLARLAVGRNSQDAAASAESRPANVDDLMCSLLKPESLPQTI